MPKRITIPATIEEATEQLEGLAGLLTAKEWERAAIIYAFTYPQQGRRSDLARRGAKLGITEFAKLGITGFEKRDTVSTYHSIWKEAVTDDEAEEVEPGERAILPEKDWPSTRTGTDGYDSEDGAITTIQRLTERHRGSKKVAAAVAAQTENPDVAAAVAENHEASKQVVEKIRDAHRRPKPPRPMPKPKPVDKDDRPEHEITPLELQGMITDFMIRTDEAKISADNALRIFEEMREALNGEQVNDLVSVCNATIGRWEAVRDFIASGGATDEALHDLINQQKGA